MRFRTFLVLATLLLVPVPPAHATRPAQGVQAGHEVGATGPAGAATPPPRTAEGVLATMTLAQRVGQLLMVGTPVAHASAAAQRAIGRYHAGSVILMGKTTAGRSTVARTFRDLARRTGPATAGVRLLVAADQEGGSVQHLQGPGFGPMPSALAQGRWSLRKLRARARGWATGLHAAGVNLDLAPVADTVPVGRSRTNQPIGRWQRELGHRPRQVATHAVAIVRGMRAAHVATAAKHFPGLGRVRGNTDVTSVVVDRVTRRRDRYLRPFRATVKARVPFVMMSLASYPRLDRTAPAVFSRKVIHGMLRGDLGFDGVVVSDSLVAAAVARWSPAQRALRFVAAGGDLLLVPTAGPVPQMYDALLARARRSPGFRSRVDDAALHVLRAKQAQGLL